MHEKMEHLTSQFIDWVIPFPHEAEGGIEKSSNVQALHAKAEGQLDWPQIESPNMSIREEEEEEQWKDIDIKEGFYGQHEQTTSKAWDAREATRAIKDEEID